jgi:hypothetical protein
MHEILSNHPQYAEHQEKVADLNAARGKWETRTRELSDKYQVRLSDYRREKSEALLRGERPPPEPEPPEVATDEARLFQDRMTALRAEERELLADLCDEIEAAAVARERELADEARPLVAELQRKVDEAAELTTMMRTVRLRRDRRDGVPAGHGVSDRMRQKVTVVDMLTVVAEGGSLFDPVEPSQPEIVAASFEPEPEKPVSKTMRDRI